MNKTNCAPGGRATQAVRSPERKVAIGAMGGRARAACGCKRCSLKAKQEIGRKGGTITQARKTAAEKSVSGLVAARGRWGVYCQKCEAIWLPRELLDREACPRCRLVL